MNPPLLDLQKVTNAQLLIVEDEHIVAMDLELSLRTLGYKIAGTVSSGPDAIRRAEELRPDLILMDIRLQGEMDGIDAADQIQTRFDIPVVFLTAHADEATLQRARSVAPYGYVLKPFDDRELHVTVMMALCKHQAFTELEHVVQERTVQLAQAVRFRDEFLVVASHELRTPLTALRLQIEGMEQLVMHEIGTDQPLATRLMSKLSSAERGLNRLANLVERLLDVSGLETQRLSLRLEEGDLASLIADVLESVSADIQRAGCELRSHITGPIFGYWDQARIEQIIINLITNATRFGAGKPIDVYASANDNCARIVVQDQGIGIPKADQERIFGRFERAVPSNHYGGLGLGLYITRQIVQAHGGLIRVDSAPGTGSTFMIDLPRRTSESAPAPP